MTSMAEQKKIILVRHGETQWNLQNRLQGHRNSPLTRNGELQALETKRDLSQYNIHGAYVSPLKRAQDTMDIIIKGREIKAIESNNLKEISLGPWEGKTKEETKKSHPTEYDLFWNKPHEFSLSGAETYLQLQERVVSELKNIFEKETHKTILVVTHWIAIKVVMAYFTSTPLNQLSSLPDLGNGEFLTLFKEGEQISVSGL
jgi:broad specificity phosphatase PhoE